MIRPIRLAGLVILLFTAALSGQNAPPGGNAPAGAARPSPTRPIGKGTGVVRGRVVTAENGTPLRRAQIRLTLAGAVGARSTATDNAGQYEFADLPAGRYALTASKTGYVSLAYGQRRALDPGKPLDVSEARAEEHIDFALPRGATIVAHVTDDLGGPLAGIFVNLYQFRYAGGERRLAAADLEVPASSDDRGRVTIAGLPPGDYYVGASRVTVPVGSTSSTKVLAPTYYPGVTTFGDAQRITLAVGQSADVTFPLADVRTARVRGVVRTATGEAATGIIGLQPVPAVPGSGMSATLAPDGSFSFARVTPGGYVLRLPANQPEAVSAAARVSRFARLPITVTGADIDDVTVMATTGATVRGHFVFDGRTEPPPNFQPDTLNVVAVFVEPSVSVGSFKRGGDFSFTIEPIVGRGMVRLQYRGPGISPFSLKELLLDGRDVTDTIFDFSSGEIANLEVVLTDKRTELGGTAVDGRNAPINEYVAVVFPTEPERRGPQSRFVAAGRPNQQGAFRIVGLPPGRYLAAAVPFLEDGAEQDKDLLTRLEPRAVPFTLADGESKAITLRLVP